MSDHNSPAFDNSALDPVFLHGRREALVILAAFFVLLVWSVGCCYALGYGDLDATAGKVAMVFGIPSWVFWGVGVPWIAADLFTIWFCFFYMAEDDLGEVHENADLAEQIEHDQIGQGNAATGGADA